MRATTAAACIYTSARRHSTPTTRRPGPTLFSCGASRNKRECRSRGARGWDYPTLLDGRSQRGPNEHREVADLRRGWLRPARPVGSQELGFFLLGSSSGASPGARLRRSLRAEDGDSGRNRAIRLGLNRRVEAASKRRVAGLRGGRLRPARLYEPQKHSPKFDPILRPVCASLRLRCRSAALAVARWNFISILLTAK